jgi:hypothetical protein
MAYSIGSATPNIYASFSYVTKATDISAQGSFENKNILTFSRRSKKSSE